MKMPTIKKVSPKNNTYYFTDFGALTDFSLSLLPEKECVSGGLFETRAVDFSGLTVKKIYSFNGKNYYYCDDKNVYEVVDGQIKKCFFEQFETPPKSFVGVHRNSKSLYFVDGGKARVIGEYFDYLPVPDGSNYSSYRLGLYFSQDDLILFCPRFFAGITTKEYFTFRAERDEGKVLFIAVIGARLFVFYARAIYEIVNAFQGGKAELVKVQSLKNPALENSFAVNGRGVRFINVNGEVFSFDAIKLTGEDVLGVAVNGVREAWCDESEYQAETTIDGEKYVYRLTDGKGYFIRRSELYRDIEYGLPASLKQFGSGRSTWKSKRLDFGVKERKTVSEIKITVSRAVKLKVQADGDQREFLLDSGKNTVRTCMRGKIFVITVESPDGAFTLNSLSINYKVE